MGTISTGVGLISGIDTAALIDSLITLASTPKFRLQESIATIKAQQTAMMDINARLLNLKTAARDFRINKIFQSALATSNNEDVLTASAGTSAAPGTYQFLIRQLVTNSQKMTQGFASANANPVGLSSLSFEFGHGKLSSNTSLDTLNGGAGVRRGDIIITDKAGASKTIDLSEAVSMDEVLEAINSASGVNVTAAVSGDKLTITDNSGGAGTLSVANAIGSFTATDLGINFVDGSDADSLSNGIITGSQVNSIGSNTSLSSLNDGNGVLLVNNNPDISITSHDGSIFSIDFGRIDDPITSSTLLSDLNNGSGVKFSSDPDNVDFQIVDKDGTTHDISLNGATTVGDLVARVSTATGGKVTLAIHADQDKFVLTDTTSGSGLLQVIGSGENGDQTAKDLGILNTIGESGTTFDGTTIINGSFTAAATTIQQIIDRVNNAKDTLAVANGGRIVASIAADGVSLKITDTTSGVSNLIITSTAANPNATADLGIETKAAGIVGNTVDGTRLVAGLNSVLVSSLNGGNGILGNGTATLAGTTPLSSLFQGTGITTNGNGASPDILIQDRTGATYNIEVDGLTSVQDLINAVSTATGGVVTLAINGQKLEATNTSVGASNFKIQNLNGASVASELGIVADNDIAAGDVVTGVDTKPASGTKLDITNRNGIQTIIDLAGAESVQDIMNLINNAGAGVTASLNDSGNGLKITDTTGGTSNLILTGDAASALGVTANVASNKVNGSNLQLQYVSEGSKLEDLNFGLGIGIGSFRITDGYGNTATISISSSDETLFDIIKKINGPGLAIKARINDNGDGIVIDNDPNSASPPQTGAPVVALKVESLSGSTANDLGILGTATAVNTSIDGSYERVVQLNPSDTLDEIVSAINSAGIPISASVINTGTGTTPFRLSFASEIGGTAGDLVIDTGGVDLGLTTLTEARNAKVFFGSDDPATALFVSSTSNTLDDVVAGVTIDLHTVSDDVVTLTVARDQTKISDAVKNFVTTINDVIGRIDQYDFFDVDTEERGILLSNSVTSRLRSEMFRTIQGKAQGVSTQFQFLSQVGIQIGTSGTINFDQAKFDEVYAADPQAVENLFAAFESTAATAVEIVPGVTVTSADPTISVRGFGDIFDQLAEEFTNSIDGVLTLAGQNFQTQVDSANDRIELIDLRLETKRSVLERQFLAMEVALAKLQGQNGALISLTGNLALAQSFGT